MCWDSYCFPRLIFKSPSKWALTVFQAQQRCSSSWFSMRTYILNSSVPAHRTAWTLVGFNTVQCPCRRKDFLEICLGRSFLRVLLFPQDPSLVELSSQLPLSVCGRRIQALAASPGAPHTSEVLGDSCSCTKHSITLGARQGRGSQG